MTSLLTALVVAPAVDQFSGVFSLCYQYSLRSLLLLNCQKLVGAWITTLLQPKQAGPVAWNHFHGTWDFDTSLTIPKLKSCSWIVYVRLEQGSVQGWVSLSCSSFCFSYRELQNSSRKRITDWTQQEFLRALIAQNWPEKSSKHHQTWFCFVVRRCSRQLQTRRHRKRKRLND